MTLEQYLKENDLKPVAFATSIGVAPSTITRILRGERSPGLDLMLKIKTGTGGAVSADDWLASAESAA